MMDLARFVAAQEPIFPQVRAELSHGQKRTHWMWFVFPQVIGLGSSPMARRYAIADLDEARAYLAHPILRPRLEEATRLALGWAGRRSAAAMLGPVDAMKFGSSMTLFEIAALGDDIVSLFGHALEAFCQGRRDRRTLELLNVSDPSPSTFGELLQPFRRSG
ncbi:DUF1810 domain-containing protein [Novosphingobium guangzhouense]|uniref:Calpastatin n=1 Tax=Novosphingobium guangzhouense TaxID=1850347 RepID=A0A2K2FUL0_9SPHN|nr:DUF1810 domain-containing protein [Novosphingobium guangzhouense]PNU02479.1 calpastatin [Novosphingobium guangzhouense]